MRSDQRRRAKRAQARQESDHPDSSPNRLSLRLSSRQAEGPFARPLRLSDESHATTLRRWAQTVRSSLKRQQGFSR